jgi:uncharacterized protein YaiL (DUF2058 family)
MASSLRDQLLKAGLVDKSKLQKAKSQARKKQRRGGAAGQDSVAQAVARAEADKRNRDRELNRQKERKQAAKARKALLRQFVHENRLNDPAADEPYNFVHDGAVKRVYVTAGQRRKLGAGTLAIVQAEDRYHLVPFEVSQKVLELLPGTFVFVSEPETPTPDDPYAEYQVPDDLRW